MKLEDAAQFESQRQVSITKSQAQGLSGQNTQDIPGPKIKYNDLADAAEMSKEKDGRRQKSKLKALQHKMN